MGGFPLTHFPGPEEFLRMRRPRKGYLGRKWDYLRQAARSIAAGEPDLGDLMALSYNEAWRSLVIAKQGHVLGIGPKVADCVLLFSLEKPEAFPIGQMDTARASEALWLAGARDGRR